MAEGGVGTCPQVFVVDSQANYVSVPGRKKSRWATAGQKSLLLLVGLALSGLVIEGCFIYRLYKRTEVRLISACDRVMSETSVLGAHGWKFLFSRISLFSFTSR